MQASNHDIWQDIRGWHCDWLHIHHLIHTCRAAPQRYSVVGFIDKNKDTLFQDFKRLLYNRWNTHTQLQTGTDPWWHGIYCRNWIFFCVDCETCLSSSNQVLKKMWPEGKLSITEVTKRPLTAATLFKNSMISLVENLASKVTETHGLS